MTHYQVRWNWRYEDDPEGQGVQHDSSPRFTALRNSRAIAAARRFKLDMELAYEMYKDAGVVIENLRIVETTERPV